MGVNLEREHDAGGDRGAEVISWSFDPRAFRDRVGRRLIGSYLASLVGDYMVLAAMPIAVASLHGGAWAIAVVLAAQGFAVLGGLVVGGLIGDQLPRRSIMIAADVVRLVSQAAVAVLLIMGDATVWELVVAQLIHGIATGCFLPAADAIVPEAVGEDAVQATNGSKGTAWSIAAITGPVLGGTVAAALGPGWAMAADAATFAVSASLLTGVPLVRRQQVEPQAIGEQFREGLAVFASHPWLGSIVVQWTLINSVAIAPFFVLGPVLSNQHWGGPGSWALMLFALGVGELFGSLTATAWRPDRPLVASLRRVMLWAVPVALMAAGAPFPLIIAALLPAGFGLMSFDVVWKSTLQREIPEHQRARVIALDLLGSFAVIPFGFLFGAGVAAAISPSAALLAGAILVVGSTGIVLALPSVRGLHARPTTPGGEVV